jgi:hypothetical protein
MNSGSIDPIARSSKLACFVFSLLLLALGFSIAAADEVPRKDFNAAVTAVVDECLAKAGVTETSASLEQIRLIRARVEDPLTVLPDKLLTDEYLDWYRDSVRVEISPDVIKSLIAAHPNQVRSNNSHLLKSCTKGFPLLAQLDFRRSGCQALEDRVEAQTHVVKALILKRIAAGEGFHIHKLVLQDYIDPLGEKFLARIATKAEWVPEETKRDIASDLAALIVLRSVEQTRIEAVRTYRNVLSDLFQVAWIADGIAVDAAGIAATTQKKFEELERQGPLYFYMDPTRQLSYVYLKYVPLCFGHEATGPGVIRTPDRDPAKHPENFIEIPIPPELLKRFE